MVEQLTVNQLVAGSSPARGAKKMMSLVLIFFCFGQDEKQCLSEALTKEEVPSRSHQKYR
jgi:hypothetical protein